MKRILILLGALCLATKAHSNAMEDVIQQNLGAFHNVSLAVAGVLPSSNTVISSGTVGMTLYYNGTASESDVSITQSSITFFAPFPTVDTTVGQAANTAGYFDISVATMTMGAMCATINQSTSYRCLLGGLRSEQSPKLLLDQVAQLGNGRNLKAIGGYQVGVDTGGVTGVLASGLLGPSTSFFLAVGMTPTINTHRVVLRKCIANAGDATGLNLHVFGVPRYFEGTLSGVGQVPVTNGVPVAGGSTTLTQNSWGGAYSDNSQVSAGTLTANTDTAVDYTVSQGSGMGFEFAKGTHVVVQTGPINTGNGALGGSVGYSTNNFLQCFWDEKP